MALGLRSIEFIFDKKYVKNKDIVFIGDHRISFDKFPNDLLKKFSLDNSINLELKKIKKDGVSQKKFLSQLFKKFGFENLFYLENFISENIDFTLDLSIKDASKDIKRKFGIVVDNGTSIYASNVINSLENIFDLIDINGFLSTNIDPMSFNRFPMQPSPESLTDIMVCHGLETEIFVEQNFNSKLSTRKKYFLNYYEKHTPISEYLEINQFFFHLIYLIKNFFSFRKSSSKHIYANDYLNLKKNNFNELKNIAQTKKIYKEKKKINWRNNFIFRFIKDRYYRLNTYINNRGRVSIVFEAEKKNLNPNLKTNSSTIYYTIYNQQ